MWNISNSGNIILILNQIPLEIINSVLLLYRTLTDYLDLFDPATDVIESRDPVEGVRLGVTSK